MTSRSAKLLTAASSVAGAGSAEPHVPLAKATPKPSKRLAAVIVDQDQTVSAASASPAPGAGAVEVSSAPPPDLLSSTTTNDSAGAESLSCSDSGTAEGTPVKKPRARPELASYAPSPCSPALSVSSSQLPELEVNFDDIPAIKPVDRNLFVRARQAF